MVLLMIVLYFYLSEILNAGLIAYLGTCLMWYHYFILTK